MHAFLSNDNINENAKKSMLSLSQNLQLITSLEECIVSFK